ncbi:MAG: hypothetical protein AAF513_09785 [Pseudomonadota bacterium]
MDVWILVVMFVVRFFFFALWLCYLPAQVHALDLRVVADVSTVAHAQDAAGLRQKGIAHLAALLPEQSRAGLWYYSRHVEEMVAHSEVDGMWKQLAAIHGRNMGKGGKFARLDNALRAALWDLDRVDPTAAPQIVLFSNGGLRGPSDVAETGRNALLNELGPQIAVRDVRVHVIATGEEQARDTDFEMLRQLTQLSGGLFVTARDKTQLRQGVADILDHARQPIRAPIDEAGRFRVAPGASSVTITWPLQDSGAEPALLMPSGKRLDRLSFLANGRWVVGDMAEIVTLQSPQSGWWRLEHVDAAEVLLVGEVRLQVDGLRSPLVPSEENRAHLTLYHEGRLVDHPRFLDQVHVRAWLKTPRERGLMPIDRTERGYEIYLINLLDGPHVLEVELAAPTFTRFVSHPFVVRNPLQVTLSQKAATPADAWLSFNHAEVDFTTVRAAAKVRKPPQPGKLIPATKLPGGLYHISLGQMDGILEVGFTLSGNYLSSEGFFLRTKPVTVSLPMVGEEDILRFDVDGRVVEETPVRPVEQATQDTLDATEDTPAGALPENSGESPGVVLLPPEPAYLQVPIWITATLACVVLLIGAGLWFWLRARPLEIALEPAPKAS